MSATGVDSWRAGCAATRTSGSEGGPGKRASRKAGTAPRSDPYRVVFHEPDTAAAVALLDAWLARARRCRIASFVKLAKTISAQRAGIVATLTHRLSNARTEAANTTPRLITRRAYGFHPADALIALAMLTVGGLCPPLPGRAR